MVIAAVASTWHRWQMYSPVDGVVSYDDTPDDPDMDSPFNLWTLLEF